MDDIPNHIIKYLENFVGEEKTYGLLALNLSGEIFTWYGDLEHFNGSEPEVGIDIYDYCSILEGILPLESQQAVLPNIEIVHGSVFADIHLLFHNNVYWILFIDSTQIVEGMREWLQNHNESQLDKQNQQEENSSDNA